MLHHVIKNVTFLWCQAHARRSSSVTNLSKFGQPYLKIVLNFTTILPFTRYKSPLCDWITSAAWLKAVYVLEIIELILSHEEKCVVVCVMKTNVFSREERVSYSGCGCSEHLRVLQHRVKCQTVLKARNVNEARSFSSLKSIMGHK